MTASDDEIRALIGRMAALIADIQDAGLQARSIISEAEFRLFEERNRQPCFSPSPAVVLASYELDTTGLRWWLRGTDAGLALARIPDEEIVAVAKQADGLRDAALDRMDVYADALGEWVVSANGGKEEP